MITLVTGSNGQLGKTIQSIVKKNTEFIFTDIDSLDITKKEKIVVKSYDISGDDGRTRIANCRFGSFLLTFTIYK